MKKPHLYLHIGTEKTGTTSVQSFCTVNSSRLLNEKSLYYPIELGGKSGHTKVALMAYSEDRVDELVLAQGCKNKNYRIIKYQQWREQLTSNVKNVDSNYVLLSSEHFHSRLHSDEDFSRLRSLLLPLFKSITIVMYVREPVSCATAMLSTAIKGGRTDATLPLPTDPYFFNICNHQDSIERWQQHFPEAQLIVRPFNREALKNRDIVHDIFDALGVDLTEGFEFPPAKNESLSREGMLILARINKVVPKFYEYGLNTARQDIVTYIEDYFSSGEKFCPSAIEAQSYCETFKSSMQWVADRYWGGDMSLWGKWTAAGIGSKRPGEEQSKVSVNTPSLEKLADCFANAWKNKIHFYQAKIEAINADLTQHVKGEQAAQVNALKGQLVQLKAEEAGLRQQLIKQAETLQQAQQVLNEQTAQINTLKCQLMQLKDQLVTAQQELKIYGSLTVSEPTLPRDS